MSAATAGPTSATPIAGLGSTLTPATVLEALDGVPDPEIPNVSVVELGMIGEIEVRADEIRVELLPTFVGCPAIEVIRDAIAARLRDVGRDVRVDVSFVTPWSSDRIGASGRRKLEASGFAPPPPVRVGRALPMLDVAAPSGTGPGSVACPFCGSSNTTLDSPFGPTQCRMVWHCADCRQPFEAFKPV